MTGLGINVISDSELKQNMSSLEEEEESISTPSTPERRTIPFRELIDSPTPTPLKITHHQMMKRKKKLTKLWIILVQHLILQ